MTSGFTLPLLTIYDCLSSINPEYNISVICISINSEELSGGLTIIPFSSIEAPIDSLLNIVRIFSRWLPHVFHVR